MNVVTLPRLLDPLKLDSIELKNRIVMPPIATNFANQKGEVTNRLIKHYSDRAENLGLLIVEHSYVSHQGRISLNQLGVYSDDLVHGLTKLVDAVHEYDTPIAIQINHAGATTTKDVCGTQPVAPSSIVHPRRGQEIPRKLSVDEIDEIIENFTNAARRAIEAGFDAVEVHGAHGFLLNQFVSPLTNKRQDEYGGSLENRVRLSCKIIERIRNEIDPNYPLLYRIGADDMLPGGITLNQGVKAARMIIEKGIDIMDVSGGLLGSRPDGLEGPGFFVPHAATIREALSLPVIGVGGITEFMDADKIIRSGKVDLVAIGRALLKEPKWAKRAIEELSN
jgi:2,4-dienoyl-CoA reductase-like NADH-dependent reductase (Old Yellow Enzyme family)